MALSSDPARATSTDQYKTSISLGHLLQQRRQELGLNLEQVEKDTKIRKQYVEFIEAGNYDRLKDDIYSRGYVKNYADYLGLETSPILLLYRKERQARTQALKLRDSRANQKIGLTPIKSPRWIITPRTFVVICIIGLLGLVLGYLIWQFTGLAAAPKLSVDKPGSETVTSTVAFVSGRVNEGADVFINDSPILTDSAGAFREKITLVQGTNQIRVSARNRLGKVASITKTYIAQLSQPNLAAKAGSVPAGSATTPFDGVQLTVKITHGVSWLIVTADNVEIYRGTMLEGSQQTFQAAADLKLSVGNAGAVDAVLTNSQVVNRDLGILGRDGETKRDLEFKKDTKTL